VTKYVKKSSVLTNLMKRFNNIPLDIPMFFVDAFDLGKPYDETRAEAAEIVKLAQSKKHFETTQMNRCAQLNWRDLKDVVMNSQLKMLTSKIISGFGLKE
jgi:hypothetical protein